MGVFSKLMKTSLDMLTSSGILSVVPYIFPNNLTVLNYHRIDDPNRTGFNTLQVNVSATPVDFERQMEYVKRHFNVVSTDLLVSWLHGKAALPSRAAMITFDDGYYDNLSNAYPILRKLNLPAVIFLATAFMGVDQPFYWDYIAYCFFNTKNSEADLPILGVCSWNDKVERDEIMLRWIEALKKISEVEKQKAVQSLDKLLQVSVDNSAFINLHLTWDQIREMSANGIEFGSHTVNHPILTRISLSEVMEELTASKRRIENELGKRILSFAYPNGGVADFSEDVVKIVREVGFDIAFTLMPGPLNLKSVKKESLMIRRIYIGNHDNYSRFVFKVSGVAKALKR